MVDAQFSRRQFLGQAMLAGGGTLLLASCTHSGSSSNGVTTSGGVKLPPIEGAEVVTDSARFPTKFNESPDFAKLVAARKLPPVAERIGQDPLVLKPVGEIGKYGGELRRGIVGIDEQNGIRFAGSDSLLYWDVQGNNVVPNLARGFGLSPDGKVTTLHLRRGMKWSDGEPFTADDIVFWSEDIDQNSNLAGGAISLKTSGGRVSIRKVDDYTVEYAAPVPYPVLPTLLVASPDIGGQAVGGFLGGGGYAPKHYLSKFLPKYSSESEANKAAKAAGFASWPLYVLHLMDWGQNPALPTLAPWTVTRPVTDAPWTFEANPYSVWVDTAGNQLPYIPKITMHDAGNTQVLNLQMVASQYDYQDRSLQLSSLPVLSQNQQRSNYTVHRAPSYEMDAVLRVNLAYVKDKVVGNLLREVDFRRALSLGIDRDQVNSIEFLGTSTPSADIVADSSPYFPGKEWRTKWATHDVAQANKLLDGLNLKKGSDGYRLRPDSNGRLELQVEATQSYTDFGAVAQLVVRQWKAIGIYATVNVLAPGDNSKILANEAQMQCVGASSTDVFISQAGVLPTTGVAGIMGIPYAQWLGSGGKAGTRPPASLKLEDGWKLYQEGQSATQARRNEIGKEVYKLHADQVWSIGIVGFGLSLYGLYCASNRLGNIPGRIVNSTIMHTAINARPMTFYYKS